jgi:hypothetical protein
VHKQAAFLIFQSQSISTKLGPQLNQEAAKQNVIARTIPFNKGPEFILLDHLI